MCNGNIKNVICIFPNIAQITLKNTVRAFTIYDQIILVDQYGQTPCEKLTARKYGNI